MAPNPKFGRSGTAPDWSKLPTDLLISILQRPSISFEDFIAFKRVCSSWRSAAEKERENFNTSRQHVPWLVQLALGCGLRIGLYSPSNQKYYRFAQPPDQRPPLHGLAISSCLGWIMKADHDSISLFNPFSGTLIQLPTGIDVRYQVPFPKKFALSANPSWTSDYTVMMVTIGKVYVFWKPGQSFWTRIKGVGKRSIVGIAYHKGRFYTLDPNRTVRVFTIEQDDKTSVVKAESVVQIPSTSALVEGAILRPIYIMESAESLLVVTKYGRYGGSFEFYEVNVSDRSVSLLKTLGDRALFLDKYSSPCSVLASECGGCEAGTVTITSKERSRGSNCWTTYEERKKGDRTLFQRKDEEDCYCERLWIQPTF